MSEERALVPTKQADVVSWEELAREQALDEASTRYATVDDEDDEAVTLLDPLVAMEREAQRYRSAPRRNRSVLDSHEKVES